MASSVVQGHGRQVQPTAEQTSPQAGYQQERDRQSPGLPVRESDVVDIADQASRLT
jgi:hypothetical protein